jgi:hypothetical protein
MLKKVVFAAVLALGFVTSFKVGASVDTGSGAGINCEGGDWRCGSCTPLGC